MERQHLTPKQAEALQNRIRPMLSFLYRCRRRLDIRGFDAKSEVYREIDKAYCAMHSLHVTVIYEACGRGVGKASEDPPGLTPSTDRAEDQPSRPDA